MINNLPVELLETIFNSLSYIDIVCTLHCNKYLSNIRSQIRYNQLVNYKYIRDLDYNDNFLNIKLITEDGMIPTKRNNNNHIHVTYLIMNDIFNKEINLIIPNTVRKLVFYKKIKQDNIANFIVLIRYCNISNIKVIWKYSNISVILTRDIKVTFNLLSSKFPIFFNDYEFPNSIKKIVFHWKTLIDK